MAAFVTTDIKRNYIDRDKLGDVKRFKDAMNGDSLESPKACNQILGVPDFVIQGTTDSNTAAASSPVISLSDEGVTFPANTYRDIEVEVSAANGTSAWRWRTRQRVLGGSDPTLKGSEAYLVNCEAIFTATLASGTPTAVAAECLSPEWWDGAAPTGAAFSSGAGVITWLGTNSPVRFLTPLAAVVAGTSVGVGNAMSIDHKVTSLANGTSTITTFTINGTEAATNPADGRIVATARLAPPVHAPVIIDTASTPDEVWIGALGITSDIVTWVVKVFVGDAVALPLV
jgi:hypothetical protein